MLTFLGSVTDLACENVLMSSTKSGVATTRTYRVHGCGKQAVYICDHEPWPAPAYRRVVRDDGVRIVTDDLVCSLGWVEKD